MKSIFSRGRDFKSIKPYRKLVIAKNEQVRGVSIRKLYTIYNLYLFAVEWWLSFHFPFYLFCKNSLKFDDSNNGDSTDDKEDDEYEPRNAQASFIFVHIWNQSKWV